MANGISHRSAPAERFFGTSARARKVIYGICLFFYTWAIAEIFIWTFDPQQFMARYIQGSDWGVRGNIPKAVYWHHTREVDVEYRINRQGLRADREYALTKPPGTCRVALFGDSFFLGYELNLEDTFAARLEQRLNQDAIKTEVLNFSVSGFGTAEMLKTYEGYGRRFDPDLAIFSWHFTDPDDNVRSDLFRVSNGKLQPGASVYPTDIWLHDLLMKSAVFRLIEDHSQVYRFAEEQGLEAGQELLARARNRVSNLESRLRKDHAGPPEHSKAKVPFGDASPYAKQLSGLILKHAHDEIVADKRAFILVDIPRPTSRVSFESGIDLIPSDMRREMTILSPIDELRSHASPDRKMYFEKGFGHFTPFGIDAMLQSVVHDIENSPSLDACRIK